jgi:hypothetical protein
MSVRKAISVFILGAALLFGATSANGKAFYVSGNSNRTVGGGSCGDALSVEWFNNASSWGTASHQISAGTTVYLCGIFNGRAGQQLLWVRESGTAASPIIIKFLPGAVLSAPYWSSWGAIDMDNRSHIIVDGGLVGVIQNTQNGTGRAYHQNSVAVHAAGCFGCTVRNLTMRNLYVRTSNNDLTPTHSTHCVFFQNADSFTISHVTCHDAAWAFAGAGNYFTLEYAEIYRVDHGVASGPNGKVRGYSIHHNHFHDFANWDSPNDSYHHDGVHLWGANGGAVTSGAIYNNTFDGDFGVNVTGHIFLQNSIQHVSVYNNVFVAPSYRTISSVWIGATSTSMVGGSAVGNSVYNNSINAGGHRTGTAIYADNQLWFTAVNNILSGGSSDISLQHATTLSSTGVNHNLYRDLFGEFGDTNTFGLRGYTYRYLPPWQNACRCDGASRFVSSSQTTAFDTVATATIDSTAEASSAVATVTLAPEAASMQAEITPSQAPASTRSEAADLESLASQGQGGGLKLSEIATGELVGLSFDKNGKERPAAGPWNIGPY